MINLLKNILNNHNSLEEVNDNKNLEQLCGLMIEAAYTDGQIDKIEINKIRSSLVNVFTEDQQEVNLAIDQAIQNKNNSKSLHHYTSHINKNFDDNTKLLLIETLWEIVLSDGEVHDFESNLLRRLAGLLYISDVSCGSAKKRALAKLQ